MKTPSQLRISLFQRSFTNYLALYLLLPHLSVKEDLDYATIERGVVRFELELPTRIFWGGDRDHWSFSLRVLGLGFTLVRQWSY